MSGSESTGTLIIGAGVIGSAVAMHLAQKGLSDIRVIDPDLEGSLSSSELNAGGVRATFSQPINVRMSRLSIDYFDQHAQDVGYRACGYLWLYTPEKLPLALRARERHLELGLSVEVWEVAELRRRIPFIDKTDDLAAALFSPRDGLVNPNLLKLHFRERAKALGVRFDDRTRVVSATYEGGLARVRAQRFEAPLTPEQKLEVFTRAGETGAPAIDVTYAAKNVINCAGPWAAEVARALGYTSPSYPVRRQISIFDSREVDLSPYGMMIDTSGVYFHPEATNGLAGFATRDEPRGAHFAYDGEDFFMETIWAPLYERSSKFERLKHLTGWAGLYDVSPDESAILGLVQEGEAGRYGRVFECHSFSGHGVMHSHAAGLAMAELIADGAYRTIDASALAGARFGAGRAVSEDWVI